MHTRPNSSYFQVQAHMMHHCSKYLVEKYHYPFIFPYKYQNSVVTWECHSIRQAWLEWLHHIVCIDYLTQFSENDHGYVNFIPTKYMTVGFLFWAWVLMTWWPLLNASPCYMSLRSLCWHLMMGYQNCLAQFIGTCSSAVW